MRRLEPRDIRGLARSLRRIQGDLLKGTDTGGRCWFQGAEPYFEIWIERDGVELSWFQLTVRGIAVTWDKKHGVSTGTTNEGDVDGALHPASKVITPDRSVDEHKLELAVRILEARADLREFDDPVQKLVGSAP